VARYKSEFLAGYWQRHGTPWGARAIGHIRDLSTWGSRLAPWSNTIVRSGAGRWLGEKLFGIDRRRTLPPWTRRTLARRFAQRRSTVRRSGRSSSARTVILFNDTFTNYCHPEIGMAAADVLDAGGVGARLVTHSCCGRPLISQGLLDEARSLAAINTEALHDAAAAGQPIVFLEPSCLSAVREDAPALLRGDMQRRARVVGGASVLFEEYVEREWQANRFEVCLKKGPAAIVLHAHCHQRAMGLHVAARSLLSRIPSCTVTDLDAGCCGMAGSFGYTTGHYDVSRQIGERKLLPAARSLPPGAVLAAAGMSCRQQVAHFTGVYALHPAMVLRALVDTSE